MEFLVKDSPSWNFYYEGAEQGVTVREKGGEYYFDVPAIIDAMTIYLESYDARTHKLKGRVQIEGEKASRPIAFEVEESMTRMEGTPDGFHGNRRWTLMRPGQEW